MIVILRRLNDRLQAISLIGYIKNQQSMGSENHQINQQTNQPTRPNRVGLGGFQWVKFLSDGVRVGSVLSRLVKTGSQCVGFPLDHQIEYIKNQQRIGAEKNSVWSESASEPDPPTYPDTTNHFHAFLFT